MDIQFGDIQETALVTLAIRASETARENHRIEDVKAKEIIETLGVDVSKYDPFLSHEGVVARTIMFADALDGAWTATLPKDRFATIVVMEGVLEYFTKEQTATFKWGTKSGAEFVELEPRLTLLSEHSYNEEMRKHTLRGKLFAATFGKNVNNRIAVFRW